LTRQEQNISRLMKYLQETSGLNNFCLLNTIVSFLFTNFNKTNTMDLDLHIATNKLLLAQDCSGYDNLVPLMCHWANSQMHSDLKDIRMITS
jgi:hypothetical protein